MTDDDDTQATNGSVVVEQHNKKEEIINIAEHFHVVDAFSLPNLVYDEYRGTFQKSSKKGLLLADGRDKSSMFKERLLLVKQRLLRNEDFAPAMAKEASYVKLTPIKELIGHDGKFFVLLGMLTQIEQGKIHLEDAGGHIELDLSDVVYDHGLFTDGIIVIIEGTYTYDHNFKVKELGLPPPEPRHMTEALLEHIDFLGVPKPLVEHRLLLEEEIAHKDISFVILSNVYLDQPKIMTALSTLFDSYQNQLVPLAFIFIGNFSSKPFHYTPTESAKYRDNFTALGDLIGMYPEMATHTNFVFVPGPRDPWNDEILPQHPLPASFVSKLKRKLRKATFTTNPCRIRYCTQDMVIYREDLLNKLMKRTLITTNLDCDPKAVNHLIHTIVDQGHLNPLPLRTKSVYWAFDNGLRLYPLPHTLVLADSCEAYSVRYQDTLCVNPSSSIVDSRFSWTIYYPATKKTTQR
ncbi:DNA polymerase alpha/epsilon subunit B-domain-containing protein [Pilobolus umbonatus]|nr:DNA polymerase alpha/epsilon subunit B-domain-containing protein [Pilobolus umbonatus]